MPPRRCPVEAGAALCLFPGNIWLDDVGIPRWADRGIGDRSAQAALGGIRAPGSDRSSPGRAGRASRRLADQRHLYGPVRRLLGGRTTGLEGGRRLVGHSAPGLLHDLHRRMGPLGLQPPGQLGGFLDGLYDQRGEQRAGVDAGSHPREQAATRGGRRSGRGEALCGPGGSARTDPLAISGLRAACCREDALVGLHRPGLLDRRAGGHRAGCANEASGRRPHRPCRGVGRGAGGQAPRARPVTSGGLARARTDELAFGRTERPAGTEVSCRGPMNARCRVLAPSGTNRG